MRVLQINTVYKNGGSTGRIVYDLSNMIKESGYESFVAYGYEYQKTNDLNTYKMESLLQLKFSILQTRLFGRHGFYNKAATRKLIRWIENVKPDLIHLHNLHNHYINIELLFNYLKQVQIPIVWTLHDCWAFTGWCAYFDYTGCEKWVTGCNKCPNLKEYPYTWFFDRSEENYCRKKAIFNGIKNLTLVTPSDWLNGLVKKSFLSGYPVLTINNGIDLNIFKYRKSNFREKNNISEDKIMILAIAMNASKRKGFSILMDLAQKMNGNYIFVLVGLDKKKIKNLPKNIIGIERTNNPIELAEIYSAADIFINPTLEDNFPTTNLEALACGTPVITFDTGGCPESIDETVGLVVNKSEGINGLIKGIGKIMDIQSSMRLRENCINKAKKFYSKQDRFNDYIKLYNKVVSV